MVVATLNLRSLRRQDKLDLLLSGLSTPQLQVTVLLGQETWHSPATADQLQLPSAWEMLSVPHASGPEETRQIEAHRRGLLVLAYKPHLQALGWTIHLLSTRSCQSHDFMVVRVGPWYMVSVYVPTTNTTGPRYHQLAEELLEICGPANLQHLIVGGDFNHPHRHASLTAAFRDILELLPLLKPPNFTRQEGNQPGSLLDNIYRPRESGIYLKHLQPFDLEPRPEAPEGGGQGLTNSFSDHLLVGAALPWQLPAGGQPGQASGPRYGPPPRPPPQVSYRKLRLLSAAAKGKHTGPDPPITAEAQAQAQEAAQAQLQAISDQLEQGPPDPQADLAAVRDWITGVMRTHLGSWRPRAGQCHPYLAHPAVKAALTAKRKARRTLSRAIRRRVAPRRLTTMVQLYHRASKAWCRARDAARAQTRRFMLERCSATCTDPTAGLHTIFAAFKAAAGSRPSSETNPYLRDPQEAAACWQQQFNRTGDDISQWPPYCQVTLTITAAEVKAALKAMKPKAPGPDHMDFRALSTFESALAPVLATAFTRAMGQGLPDALRESKTLLLSKPGKARSPDPADYRPVTLMDMVVRVYHKALELKLGAAVEARLPPAGGIHPCQAGFTRRRSCHEQVLLLQLVQAIHRESFSRPRKFLGALLLDITKCFDSLEHDMILRTLQGRGYPLDWLEVLRQLLPGNRTRILGHLVYLGRGSPQGGALSPLLCKLVLDELAVALLTAIEQDPDLGDLWRAGRSQRHHDWRLAGPTSPEWRLWLMLLQFADDVTILASSPQHAQRLLDIAYQWALDFRLRLSAKSSAVLLSAQRPRQPQHLPPMAAGDLSLSWEKTTPFRLLGVTCQSAFSFTRNRGATVAALDVPRLHHQLRALREAFELRRGEAKADHRTVHYVSPPALRLGIDQVIFARYLFGTPLVDTDYARLDSLVMRTVRSTLQLPSNIPTAYLRWELRLWPSQLRAHKRALMFAAKLLHHERVGHHILQPYLREDLRRERAADDLHPIFSIGPLARLSSILAEYGLTWVTLLHSWSYERDDRAKLSSRVESSLLLPRFVARLRSSLADGSSDLPATHRALILETMELPSPERCALVAGSLPLYLYLEHDLPRAGLFFRAPYLRYTYRGAEVKRAPCLWCRAPDSECGYHLLRCRAAPIGVQAHRHRALRLIHTDRSATGSPVSAANIKSLYRLSWRGGSSWRPSRPDTGSQPSKAALTAALVYMRECLIRYSIHRESASPAGSPVLRRLPRFGPRVEPEPVDLLAVTAHLRGPPGSSGDVALLTLPPPADSS